MGEKSWGKKVGGGKVVEKTALIRYLKIETFETWYQYNEYLDNSRQFADATHHQTNRCLLHTPRF